MKWFWITFLVVLKVQLIKSNIFLTNPINLIEPLPDDVSATCKNHVKELLKEVKNLTLWAIQMIDANSKLQSGLLMGNVHSLGNFEECLMSKHPLNKFSGKYCLLKLHFFNYRKSNILAWGNLIDIAAGRVDPSIKGDKQYLKQLPDALLSYRGICLPSSCSIGDIFYIIQEVLFRFEENLAPLVDIGLTEDNCYTQNSVNKYLSLLDYFAVMIFSSTALMIFASTFFRHFFKTRRNDSLTFRIIQSFCILDNWRELVSFTEGNVINYLNGLRVISAISIVIWHDIIFHFIGITYNQVEKWKLYYNNIYVFFWFTQESVDTFLLISGLLRSYNLMAKYDKGRFEFLKPIIGRYMRSSFALAYVIIFHMTVFPKLSSGPFWNEIMQRETSRCSKNWFHAFLYFFNNMDYYGCIPQSWSLCVDFHLFIIAPLIVYPLWKYSLFGKVVMILALSTSILIPFSITFLNNLPGTFQPLIHDSPELTRQLTWIYFPTYSRMTPYFVGIFLGVVLHKTKKIRFFKWLQIFGWLISFSLFVACIHGGKEFFPLPRSSYERWITAFYAGFHRFAWSIGVGWIIYTCHSGNGGVINDILSSKIFHILGKLTFSIFITNVQISMYYVASARTPRQELSFTSIKEFGGLMFVVFLVSLIFYICIEAPFVKIKNILLEQKAQINMLNQKDL